MARKGRNRFEGEPVMRTVEWACFTCGAFNHAGRVKCASCGAGRPDISAVFKKKAVSNVE